MDMGPCPKVHSLQLRKEYEDAKAKGTDNYDRDLEGVRDRLIAISVSEVTQTPEILELSKQIKEKLKEVDQFGLEGKTDLKITALEVAEELRTQRADKQATLLLDAFNKDRASLHHSLPNPPALAPLPVVAPVGIVCPVSMGMKLFDGSDSESENDLKIKIDKEFARRFEHNKKREDLHRYEELKKRGLVQDSSESSESSSEDDDVVSGRSKKKDLRFFDALIKVRKQDPSLKNHDVKLFNSESESDENEDDTDKDGEDEKKGKRKAVYLKDLVAKQLIEDGPEFHEDEEDNNHGDEKIKRLVYNEEQERIRNEFLKAVEEDGVDEEGDLLTVKAKSKDDENEDEDLKKKVDEYFGDEVDENARFLKDYFVNKMWVDKSSGGDEGEFEMVSEDEEEVERQEEFEYRFQENAGDRVMGHSREVEGTVRKKANARKEQRKNKEDRIKAAKMERDEELRRLKNLKKKEMDERVRRIMPIAGIKADEVVPLSAKELEEEFDPEEYDRMMTKAFGNEYYDVEVDPDADSDDDDENEAGKPNFDEEDELLCLEKGWDGRNTGKDELLTARETSLEHEDDDEGDGEEGEGKKEGKRKRKQKSAILEKAKEAMLEEYFKLDYEDTIGDLKTRFKYAKTNPNRYGLTTTEILMMDDKELGQYVSMKKIAPYKDKEWKVPNQMRFEIKMKAKELLKNQRPPRHEKFERQKKKKRGFDDDKPSSSLGVSHEEGKAPLQETSGDPTNLSTTAKRRKNRAELKLSQSRLMVYGRIASKPKKKAKRWIS